VLILATQKNAASNLGRFKAAEFAVAVITPTELAKLIDDSLL